MLSDIAELQKNEATLPKKKFSHFSKPEEHIEELDELYDKLLKLILTYLRL